MQIEIKIDSSCKEPKIIILTESMSDEVNEIIQRISEEKPHLLTAFREDVVEILDQNDIFRIYSANGKVFAVTDNTEYILRFRLYELEERLSKKYFVRISNSEIINLKKVKNFDLSYSGTICVRMLDDSTAFVSRRYVSKIKQVLGM
ncbi:MAG: LytTR family DNA-binding domain-containing protein [Peptostreptococcaceae bacterium]|nr:LytTR family DNA-binding domain-containing protein [Peptostreptococcaceae bacterium]